MLQRPRLGVDSGNPTPPGFSHQSPLRTEHTTSHLSDPRKGSNPHIVRLNTERFLVPEALFRPKVVGVCVCVCECKHSRFWLNPSEHADMDQMGIVDAAAEALAACPRGMSEREVTMFKAQIA